MLPIPQSSSFPDVTHSSARGCFTDYNDKAEADQKAAQKILAAVDAWGGKPKSEAQLKKFGYVKTEGGVWELPTHILKAAGTTRKMAQRR
jgi:hypothetical protein